ncbi:MAG: PQQ-dependent sugar dehydrogenase [Bacteroidota bacterium]
MQRLILLLMCLIGNTFFLPAQHGLPFEFSDQLYSSGWAHPAGMSFDETGRMFVWDRFGRIWMTPDGQKPNQPILDLSDEVGVWNDHGLLGFALHPNFQNNGHIYLLYVVNRHHLLYFGTSDYVAGTKEPRQATIGRLTRYTLDPNTGFSSLVSGSRKVLIGETKETGLPLLFKSHGVGALLFSEDGSLLIAIGDGAAFDGVDNGDDAHGSYAPQALAEGIIESREDVGAFRAQLIDSHSGKLLRIDPDNGEGLPSNPWFDPAQPASPRSRVWTLGLRNAYRFAIFPETGGHSPDEGQPGSILAGDVGWHKWEELNLIDGPGQNFGWPLYEGMWELNPYRDTRTDHPDAVNPLSGCNFPHFAFQDLIIQDRADANPFFPNPCDPLVGITAEFPRFVHKRPLLAYSNQGGNPQLEGALISSYDSNGEPIEAQVGDPASGVYGAPFEGTCIIGGAFYDGNVFPEEYHGNYFMADHSGWIKRLVFDENRKLTEVRDFYDDPDNRIVHLTTNPADGCLYYVNYANFQIRRICFGGNAPPTASISLDKQYGPGPLEVQFSSDQSVDPNDDTLYYAWDFGDGQFTNLPNPSHTFTTDNNEPTAFEVILTASDDEGAAHQSRVTISVNNSPPQVEISSFEDSAFYSVNGITELLLAADVQDAEHRPDEMRYQWQTFLHHNTHYHPEPIDEQAETTTLVTPEGCNDEIYYFRIKLTVTDPAGLEDSDEKLVFPYCGDSPAQLTDWQANPTSSLVNLSWSSINEEEKLTYVVERSPDLLHYESLGTLQGKGSGAYNFMDRSPEWGINYYRIKMVREDGFLDFTEALKVLFPLPPSIQLSPNPARNECSIVIQNLDGIASFQLLDLQGKVLMTDSWEGSGGKDQHWISLSKIPAGIYPYEIRAGGETITGKLIKQEN